MCMDFRRGGGGRHSLGLNWGLGKGKTRQRKAEQAEPGKAKGEKHQCACFSLAWLQWALPKETVNFTVLEAAEI